MRTTLSAHFKRIAGSVAFFALLLATDVVRAQVRGPAEAVTSAARLLEHVGGEHAWRSRVLEVTERGYLVNGTEIELRITRDFVAGRRLLERRSPAGLFVEWVAAERGWVNDDGKRRAMAEAERIAEFDGLKQEPYAIYHRLANRDPELRVDLREDGRRLLVYDKQDRVLCWFRLDANRRPIGWGNFYDGQVNEHYYGPLIRFGNVSLPRWGVSTTGAFRFEYLSAKHSTAALEEP